MRAAGAAGVASAGFVGNASATNCDDDPENWECGTFNLASECFPDGREADCSYCKLDSGKFEAGCTYLVPGTDATVTVDSSTCATLNDPDGEVCTVGLKGGQSCETITSSDQQGCLSKSEISHITVEYHCDECPDPSGPVDPGEECTYDNDAITSANFGCEEVDAELAGVEEDCPVQLRLTFIEETSECDNDVGVEDVTTNSPDPIAVPECCTPERLYLETPSGNVIESEGSGFDAGRCVNQDLGEEDFDDEFCCNRASLEVTNAEDLECPVDATLNLAEGEADCSVTPGETQELSPENLAVEWTIEGDCGCEPSSIVVYGLEFGAPDLNCQCDDPEELCKIEAEDLFYDEDGDLRETPFTVDCSGVAITITEVRTKDDDEVTCFNFTSDEPLFEVFVKGGGGRNAGETYEFPCGTTDSTDEGGMLCANVHPRSGRQTAVSHVTFSVCADELDYC